MSQSQRSRVIQLYKQLAYMGREYPGGRKFFLDRLHNAFAKNVDQKDPETVDKLINHGYFIVDEIEALYKLRKYRAMKRNYYDEKPANDKIAQGIQGALGEGRQ